MVGSVESNVFVFKSNVTTLVILLVSVLLVVNCCFYSGFWLATKIGSFVGEF